MQVVKTLSLSLPVPLISMITLQRIKSRHAMAGTEETAAIQALRLGFSASLASSLGVKVAFFENLAMRILPQPVTIDGKPRFQNGSEITVNGPKRDLKFVRQSRTCDSRLSRFE